ncbi:HTH_48 domain-containing protein [Trichonephila clavipes]|nr:HTH_48 domain-containing protein [Trichonephila clavipes]
MVTGDEKWVTYDNIVRKRSRSKRGEAAQTVAKPGLTARKIPLKRQEFATRRDFVFHQDKVRPHASVVTRQKLWDLGLEVLMHPPYRPDLAPRTFYASEVDDPVLKKERRERWPSRDAPPVVHERDA